MKKDNRLQSFSIKNKDKSSGVIGIGIVSDGIITVGKSSSGNVVRTAIFSLKTKEIKYLINDLKKLV